MSQRQMTRDALIERVGKWFDDMARDQPRIDDGFARVLKLTGGLAAFSDKDEPLFTVRVEETTEEEL